ncbi:hypothetical protein HMPREF1624_03023 [Sporothrix schenckii ATCC 58251]|uniref:Uncharacterized protein n=1 Tax=Sporothrix schenckii (strain ATCC 58251 / de Perez 2211183) TaxID=1391915 RepID=U7PXJ4_SPOS1|nr:hypothetical protein HMPREF1624_03023 [Sporothrix schenckii ATCC 58251]
MGNPSLPLAVPRTSNTSITSALANVNVATDSIDALFGIGRKGPDPSATAGNTMGANANQSMGTSDKSATSPVTNILGSQSTNIASTLAGDEAPGRTGASNLTPPTSSGPPVYKARRTPSESAWHREGRSNAELARQIKPEVPNCVGALTSAAIASALAPLHIPAGAVSPTLSVSSASSSMFVTKYPETIESERGENGSAVGSIGSNTNNTKKNDPNERNKGAVGAARDASVGSTAKSKGSGFSKVPDQFILPDYLRIKQDGPLGSPGHKANASESGINQGKKHARSSSTGVDDGPPGGIPERPRKRVSFGSVSYTNPEHQPLSPAQSAQTKRKSSLFTSTAQAAQSTPKQAPALPAQDPPPARRASEPSPSKTLGGSASLPSKASPTPIKVNDSSDKLANRPVAKGEAPANEVVPDKVPRTAVVHSPTKFHRLFIKQSPTKSRAAVAKVLAAPVKYQVVPPKPEATPAKPPCGPTHPPPSLPPKPPVAQIKTQPTPAMSQKPPRKDAPAKPEAIPTKKQTLPVKTQSSPTKKVLQSKNAVPAKAGEAMPAPAVSKPQVQKNNDTRPVLSDLSLRETATPQPQIPATSEFSEAERRAEQAQAVIEFIKAQTTAQLGCLQPLLKSGGAENNMLQCNLEMIRAQLDALGYASRAALDRIQARKHQRRKENEPVAGA